MALYAGVDEAGYGPMLGPLVVGCAAIASEKGEEEIWEELSPVVKGSRAGWEGLVVQDSKKLFKRSEGLGRLEEGCLAFVASGAGKIPATSGELFDMVGGAGHWDSCPWYEGAGEICLPVAAGASRMGELRAGLSAALSAAGASTYAMRATPVFCAELNGALAGGRSKADVVFEQVMGHVKALLDSPEEEILITCDKLGGRNFYAALLQQSLGGWLEVVYESHVRSEYALKVRGKRVRLAFVKEGEEASATVALASMLSKYVRELFMGMLNAYWCGRVEGLQPTAGYVEDGRRFIEEISGHPDFEKYRPVLIRLK